MKNRKLLIAIALFIFSHSIWAQTDIQTQTVLRKKVSYVFSEEWQYLSSDLYLFNSDKFNILINDIARDLSGDRGGGLFNRNEDPETLTHLFIKANIKDVEFFGGNLTYPIYNFQVEKNSSDYYQTLTGSSAEVIRIIDDLPLASSNDFIEAEISGEVITSRNGERLNSVIASQLKNISGITSPSSAVLELVGEFGELLSAKAQDRKYEFSTTIRLYEDQDFDERLHSINVYVFAPSTARDLGCDTRQLENFLDTADNPRVDRTVLSDLIRYTRYPYIVVANYKSRYVTEPVIGDEINFESIESRKQKNKYAFDNQLISRDIYLQEQKLIEFLEIFANLKLEINTYKLNYRNEITEDFSKNLFVIMREYRKLRNTYEYRKREFGSSPVFINEMQPSYERIITDAELYLDADNNLKDIKEAINTLILFESTQSVRLDSMQREDYLRKLHAVRLPESEASSHVWRDINGLIQDLEREQYYSVYQPYVQRITGMVADDNTLRYREDLKNRIKTSHCQFCREQVEIALLEYNNRYEEYQKKILIENSKELLRRADNQLFDALVKENCINRNIIEQYPDEVPAHIELIQNKVNILTARREKLQQLVGSDFMQMKLSQVRSTNATIEQLIVELADGYTDICAKVPELCECE